MKDKRKSLVIKKGNYYYPSNAMKQVANIKDSKIYEKASKNPIKFWENLAKENLTWEKEFEEKNTYSEKIPHFTWFKDGKLNFSINCLDRHLDKPNHPALIWIPEPTNQKPIIYSYAELYNKVNRFANVLKKHGAKKGDVVSIYLPMIPEALIAMLACTRIGAIHSVVFSAFSADALKSRIQDGKAKILITSDGYYRKGKAENLLKKAVGASKKTSIKKIILVNRTKKFSFKKFKRNILDFETEMKTVNSYCKPETMLSQDPLFILYTSGTTGKPKGVVHDTAGYAIQSYQTCKWNFDLHKEDVMWCTADVGWITGHTYAFYGPLLTGSTTLVYEGGPDFPDYGRWWKIIQDYKVNVLYTAPTAIRMFMKVPEEYIKKYDLSSLKILGSVGEPIDKESWNWYFEKIGKKKCPIIDTWFQTETGCNMINSIPGIGPFAPTISGKPFPGTSFEILNSSGKKVKGKNQGVLVQKSPFAPGMLQGIWNNDSRYKKTYWNNFKNSYDTSDGAFYTGGLIRITGRTDDVMKVAGHRLSTAELEDAIHYHKKVGDVAVVPKPDKLKGEVPIAFVVLKLNKLTNVLNLNKDKTLIKLEKEIKSFTDKKIGPTARPNKVYFVNDLPKTRSGKIMRRILRDLLIDEEPKGLTTLVNPESVDEIKEVIKNNT